MERTIVTKAQVIKTIGTEAWEKIVKAVFEEPVLTDAEILQNFKDDYARENYHKKWDDLRIVKDTDPLVLNEFNKIIQLYAAAVTAQMQADMNTVIDNHKAIEAKFENMVEDIRELRKVMISSKAFVEYCAKKGGLAAAHNEIDIEDILENTKQYDNE